MHLFELAVVSLLFASPAPARPPAASAQATPAQVAQSLLDADRAFARQAPSADMVQALSRMFAEGVMMPAPGGKFATGKAAVVAAFRSTPDAATSIVSWTPVRAGVSADGTHGFTIGYMTQRKADSSRVAFKYMAYWGRDGGDWRVLAYKRARASGPPTDTALLAPALLGPALPSRTVAVTRDTAAISVLRHDLMHAERSFSDEAQMIGLGNAFAKFGRDDAVNMGGPASPVFVFGASAIASLVGGADMKASPVTWAADTAFVSSSGDLGITFGLIHPNNPPAGAPPGTGNSFFTIWMRADPRSAWRYVAE